MKAKKTFVSFLVCLLLISLCSFSALAGWKTTANGTRYYTSSKKYVKNKWYKIKGNWFYFDKKGYRKDGRFCLKSKYYYCRPKTGAVKNDRVDDYYYNSKGVMVKSTWVKDKKGYEFYCGKDGKMLYGQFKVKGKTYYCDKKTGKVWARWQDKHYYGKSGAMVTKTWVKDSYVDENGNITKGNKDPKNASANDVRLLAALVYYEAGNQPYFGKQCVASVVLNRMNSKKFPNTLKGVIYQSGQFTPAMNGTVTALYKSSKKIQRDSIYAARTVLTEGTKLKGYYFFNNFAGDRRIGDHYFSRTYS